MIEFVINCLFPPVCGICLKLDENWICEDCKKRLLKIEKSKLVVYEKKSVKKIYRINKVSKTKKKYKKISKLEKNYENIFYKKILENNIFYFDKLLYIFKYEKLIRKLILQYKFFDKAYLSNTFEKIILNNEKNCRILKLYDIIISVPMYKNKKKERGYNQTELIAKQISKKLNIKFEKDCIKKIRNTKVQSKLNEKQRKENIKNAFIVNNKINLKNKKIILFDDIYTTGSTVNEISRILKNSGVKEILVLVIAKD